LSDTSHPPAPASADPTISPFSARQRAFPIGLQPLRLEPENTVSGTKFFDAPWVTDASKTTPSTSAVKNDPVRDFMGISCFNGAGRLGACG
jgi:hypothetical protein